jgi:hypothetical protein
MFFMEHRRQFSRLPQVKPQPSESTQGLGRRPITNNIYPTQSLPQRPIVSRFFGAAKIRDPMPLLCQMLGKLRSQPKRATNRIAIPGMTRHNHMSHNIGSVVFRAQNKVSGIPSGCDHRDFIRSGDGAALINRLISQTASR